MPGIAEHYARMQIATSGNARSVVVLHERCVHLIQQSLGDSAASSRVYLDKAQNIISQLERSLKITDTVSQGIFYLYDYCYCLLERSDQQEHRNAVAVLTTLRDTLGALHRGPLHQMASAQM